MSEGAVAMAALALAAGLLLWAGPSAGARLSDELPWVVPRWLRARPDAPSGALRLSVALVAGLGVLLPLGGPSGLACGGLVAIVVHLGLGRLPTGAEAARRRELVDALPSACILLAVGVEAGMPLRNVVALVADSLQGPLATELRRVDALVRLGVSDSEAWRELLAGNRDHPGSAAGRGAGVLGELAPLARALARSADSGVALAGQLRQQAADAARLARSRAEAAARRVGVRTVLPLMICFLPAFFLIGVVPIIGGVVGSMVR